MAYASISLASTVLWSVLTGWLLYFYLPPEGAGQTLVSATTYSVVMLAVRIINAALGLPVGYLSDRTRTRWGRRIPFMFLSGVPMLGFFVLLWMPPVAGNAIRNLIHVAFISLLFNTAYTLNQIPYTALLPEVAATDSHRVRISAWSSGAFLVGMVLGGLAGPLIDRFGFARAALVYAGGALPFLYLPFLVLREPQQRSVAEVSYPNIGQEIRWMLTNPAFRVMTVTGLCYWGVTTIIQSVIPYIVTEVCLLPTADTFDFYIPGLVASMLCYPIVTRLAQRLGKWRVFSSSLLLSALVLPGLMGIGPWLPLSLKTQGLVWITFQAVAMSGVTMLPPAFGAEITDYDAQRTGKRREGVYYAAWGLLDQLTQGFAAAVLPLILMVGRSRMDVQGPLGVRLVGLAGGILMAAGFLVFQRYPLRDGMPVTPGRVKIASVEGGEDD